MTDSFEAAVQRSLALKRAKRLVEATKGDVSGHDFHGNQWTVHPSSFHTDRTGGGSYGATSHASLAEARQRAHEFLTSHPNGGGLRHVAYIRKDGQNHEKWGRQADNTVAGHSTDMNGNIKGDPIKVPKAAGNAKPDLSLKPTSALEAHLGNDHGHNVRTSPFAANYRNTLSTLHDNLHKAGADHSHKEGLAASVPDKKGDVSGHAFHGNQYGSGSSEAKAHVQGGSESTVKKSFEDLVAVKKIDLKKDMHVHEKKSGGFLAHKHGVANVGHEHIGLFPMRDPEEAAETPAQEAAEDAAPQGAGHAAPHRKGDVAGQGAAPGRALARFQAGPQPPRRLHDTRRAAGAPP